MFDTRIRAALTPTLDQAGSWLSRAGVPALALTGAGWLFGVAACAAAAFALWPVALALWLMNRLFDALDGPVARCRCSTDRGGFLDIVADFSIYAGFVVGVAIAIPEARLACVVLLAAYYVSGATLLTLAALLERRHQGSGDSRSLPFVGGLAEGTETTITYILLCVFPGHAQLIAWVFAAAVIVTILQRASFGVRVLTSEEALPYEAP